MCKFIFKKKKKKLLVIQQLYSILGKKFLKFSAHFPTQKHILSPRWWWSERKEKKENNRVLVRLICFAPLFFIHSLAYLYRIPLLCSSLTSSSRSAKALSQNFYLARDVDGNSRGGVPSPRLNGVDHPDRRERYSIFTRWCVLFDQVVTYRVREEEFLSRHDSRSNGMEISFVHGISFFER